MIGWNMGWLLPFVWAGLGVLVAACSVLGRRSRRAYLIGIAGVGVLWILAGAFVNAYFLIRGDDYAAFADDAWTSFVRDAWRSVVAPHQGIFIGLLIAFEAAAGVLVLIEGRARQAGLVMLVSFNVLLVAFSWWFLLWSVPLVLSLVSLWRAAPVTRSGHRPPSTRRNVLGSEDLPPAVVEPFCSAATPAHVANVESTR